MKPNPPSADVTAELAALDARINALLPPRYQHCYGAVRSSSMGSAGVAVGPDGRVAWDRIWTTFCDLALAGGPPHRGSLLLPPDPAAVAADPSATAAVAEEITRAIKLVTDLRANATFAPGWVGVACESPGMAAWMLCAVVAENVSARRDGATLLLPAGPTFRVEKEVKNVVVAVAKPAHYWDGHLSDDQREAAALLHPIEPADAATPDAAAVVAAGVHDAAGWEADAGRYPGWVGVRCPSVEAAVWLLRAAIVGGVLARREEGVLFLPTGRTAGEAGTVAAAFAGAHRLWAASQ